MILKLQTYPILTRLKCMALPRWCALLALVVTAAANLNAQTAEQTVRYVRIENAGQLSEDDYIICAHHEASSTLYALSTKTAGGKKQMASALAGSEPQALEGNDDALVWHISPTRSGYALGCASGFLKVTKQEGTDVAFTSDSGESLAQWLITTTGDGHFLIAQGNERALSLNHTVLNGTAQWLFGYYKEEGATRALTLYRRYSPFMYFPDGKATLPADGSRVAISASNMLLAPEGALPMEPYALADGSLPCSIPAMPLICRHHEGDAFSLQGDDGRYLNTSLTFGYEETLWRVQKGLITSDDGRILCYDTSRQAFSLLLPEEANGASISSALFTSIGDKPTTKAANGILTLQGAWSADELANLDWQEADVLDLRALSLPVHAKPFNSRPAERNTIILTDARQTAYVPDAWSFAIACEATEHNLIRPATLLDRQSLRLPLNFNVPSGALTYSRTLIADDGWETICLPFSADLPSNVEALVYQGTEDGQDGSALFQATSRLHAGEAALLRYTGTGTTYELHLSSRAGHTEGAVSGAFFGTYEPLVTKDTEGSIYMLDATGKNFVLTAAGSTLPPFRAAIVLGKEAAACKRLLTIKSH